MSMPAVTMRDVAERAGVSKITVSHVLNGTRFMEPATEARVRLAMRELAYRPNLLARSFRRRETRTLGLLTPDIADAYWAELAQVMERVGYANGYGVLLGNTTWSVDQERAYVQLLQAKQLDGIALATMTPQSTVLDEILAADVPIVVLNLMPEEHPVSMVLVDNYRGGYLAGEYLRRLGHRHVGCITPPLTAGEARRRSVGFRQAFTDVGVDLPDTAFIQGDFTYRSGEAGIPTLIDHHPDIMAVFAANDHMALGAGAPLCAAPCPGGRVGAGTDPGRAGELSWRTIVVARSSTAAHSRSAGLRQHAAPNVNHHGMGTGRQPIHDAPMVRVT